MLVRWVGCKALLGLWMVVGGCVWLGFGMSRVCSVGRRGGEGMCVRRSCVSLFRVSKPSNRYRGYHGSDGENGWGYLSDNGTMIP